jgi:hypothetical protein
MARELSKLKEPAARPIAARHSGEAALPKSSRPTRMAPIAADRRRALIAEAAYYRSLRHPGSELEHWLAAEQEVDAQVMAHSAE